MPEAFRDIGIATVGWHCLLCGETVDDVILRNRAQPLPISPLDEDAIECESVDADCQLGINERECL